ncbi:zinc-binding alcohol dehydrogenase family protein [Amycolatopsis sp. NPDC051903]|uniref:zinc-binding alcohol dehydrogenase family protein n=1 Tax=Amycolatopsis sp. NPDC051903 TaxID=3363936 RepID=UPI003793D452
MADPMSAAVIDHHGGLAALRITRVPRPVAGPGERLVRVSRSAVNYADERWCATGVNHFTGRIDPLPFIPGGEVAGVDDESGARVVALCRNGGYAHYATAPVELVHAVPDDISLDVALAAFVPGLTAWFLLDLLPAEARDEPLLVVGASGAVGTVLLRLVRARGYRTVVATASSPAARDRIEPEVSAVVDPAPEGFTDRLLAAAGGPIGTVLDSAGGPVLEAALAALAPRGRLVTYGTASGVPATVDPRSLIVGSRTVTGFWLMDHVADRERSERALAELFGLLRSGALAVAEPRLHPLALAPTALSGHAPGGRVLLVP